MRLIAPFCRVRIGDDEFQTGDGTLLEVSVDLGEDSRSSKCSFSLADKDLYWGGKFQNISFKNGGIETPPNLLAAPKQAATSTPDGSIGISALPAGGAQSGTFTTTNPPFTPEIRAFMDLIAYKEVHADVVLSTKGYYSNNDVQGSNGFFTDADTSAGGGFPKSAGTKYNVGRYQFNRGDWEESKKTYSQIKGYSPAEQDLVCLWKLKYRGVLAPLTSGDIATAINKGGKEWASLPGSPYGQVQAGYTAAQAIDYYRKRLAIYKGQSNLTMQPQSPPPTPPQPQTIQTTPNQQQQEVSQKGTEIIIEMGFEPDQTIAFHYIHIGTESDKGGADKTTFTGQSIRWLMTRRTENKSFENVTLRQLAEIVCRKNNLKLEMEGSGPTYQYLDQTGITTYELLLRQAKSIGYSIRDEGNKLILKPSGRPEFTGIVLDRDIILSLKFGDKARGDRIPNQSTPSQEAVAVVNRQTGAVQQQKKEDSTGTGTGKPASQPKQSNQTKPISGTSGVTGSPTPAITGNVKPANASPSSARQATAAPTTGSTPIPLTSPKKVEKPDVKVEPKKNADGSTTTTTTTTNKTTERGKVTILVEVKTERTLNGTTTKTIKVTETIETIKGTTINTDDIDANNIIRKSSTSNSKVTKAALESLKLKDETPPTVATANPGTPTNATTGLPKQPIGAIDLADGRAEGLEIANESKRIKGYESSATVKTTPEILTLAPGSIIGISGNLVPEPFDREWRVYSVSHKMPGGTSSITFYTPQAAPPQTNSVTPTPTGTTNSVPSSAPGKFIFPVPSGATSIGDGYGTRAGRPPGYMHKILDVTAPQGTPVVAMADGVVKEVIPNNGGAGNMLTISYGGGYESTYMHLMPGGFLVPQGASVKQGQAVAKIGTTGRSSGPHLHLRFLLNGQACLLSQVGIDVLKMGLPVHRYNETCNKY